MTSRLAGQTITAANYNTDIDAGPNGLLARGSRPTSSTTTTSIQGVLRLDDVQLRGGRAYRICTSPLNFDSNVGTDDVRVLIKYTSDGSTPTTASTTLPGSVLNSDVGGGGTNAPAIPILTHYAPAGGDELLSLLLCVQRVAGTGNAYIFGDATQTIDMWIEDVGAAVIDTGTDI